MIDYKELRVGNYVIDEYHENRELKIHSRDISALHEGMDPHVFSPIPITIEILRRVGFTQLDELHWSIKGMKIWMCQEMFICDKTGTQFRDFHLLQNYYFFKTGFELEFITKTDK